MSESEFDDLIEDNVEVVAAEPSKLLNKLDRARTVAAYWQGVAEERAVQIEALSKDRDLTIGYLKDRLNKAEAKSIANPKGDSG